MCTNQCERNSPASCCIYVVPDCISYAEYIVDTINSTHSHFALDSSFDALRKQKSHSIFMKAKSTFLEHLAKVSQLQRVTQDVDDVMICIRS